MLSSKLFSEKSNAFKNHKNQRSQIMLDYLKIIKIIFKILQSAKSQTGSIFFTSK